MTQPEWTLTDKEKIKKTLELIQAFEDEDGFLKESSSHILYRSLMNMNDLIKEIKKTLEGHNR